MKKKYWSGNIRLLSDFFWSSILSIFVSAFSGEPRGIWYAPLYFFLFFFWSWNKQHVKKRFAKWVIHALCWLSFIFAFMGVIFLIFDREPSMSFEDYLGLGFVYMLVLGIALKYKSLMWPKRVVEEVK